jgi:hypothetical protein
MTMKLPELKLIEHANGFKHWRASFPDTIYRVKTMEHGTLISVQTWMRGFAVTDPQVLAAIRQALLKVGTPRKKGKS